MNRCPFCGEKITVGAESCEHCNKSLVKRDGQQTGSGAGLTNLNKWEKKTVPAWVMYAVLAFTAFCVYLMIVRGCESPQQPQPESRIDNREPGETALDSFQT